MMKNEEWTMMGRTMNSEEWRMIDATVDKV